MGVKLDSDLPAPEDPAGGADPPGEATAYDPPAVAWEEPFETLAAATCAHFTDVDCPGPGFPTQ